MTPEEIAAEVVEKSRKILALTPERLAELRSWANRTNPERPEFGQHNYDARCAWCRDTVHDVATEVLDEIERLRALVLVTAARATADAAEHVTELEACLRDIVIATAPLRAHDASSDVLFKLLDVRARACTLLDLDPAGTDWTAG